MSTPFLLGLSHRTAPIQVRELYTFEEEEIVAAIRTIIERASLREAVLLSTCNRTELYAVPRDAGDSDVINALIRALAFCKHREAEELNACTYKLIGIEAVRHLFRVCASLDSLVVGEAQILGQVKAAWRIANMAGTVGPVLNRLFEKAFKVAKEVRTETGIGTGQVSVGSIAVDIAKRVFEGLHCTVVLLGAGKMGENVARALHRAGAMQVTVANRTLDKAVRVAERHGWVASTLVELEGLLVSADVLIASIAYHGYMVTREMLHKTMAKRRHKPMLLVDISVPRAVEPNVREEDGVYLYDIDDFNEVIKEHLHSRACDISIAEVMVEREIKAAERWFKEVEVRPLIADLMKKAESVADHEVMRAISAMGKSGEDNKEILTAMARSIVNKLLHEPLTRLRESAVQGRSDLKEAVKELFGVSETSDEEPL